MTKRKIDQKLKSQKKKDKSLKNVLPKKKKKNYTEN